MGDSTWGGGGDKCLTGITRRETGAVGLARGGGKQQWCDRLRRRGRRKKGG
jgi:hypothetical protein